MADNLGDEWWIVEDNAVDGIDAIWGMPKYRVNNI